MDVTIWFKSTFLFWTVFQSLEEICLKSSTKIISQLMIYFRDVMSSTQFVTSKLYELVKVLLLLSHGQAAVERGLSVNKEVEVENLKHQSIIAQRIICDYVSIHNVPISEPMLKEARSARLR